MAVTGSPSSSEYKLTDIDDSERMNFMFSDFPPDRNINPKHWESKMKFWKTEIENVCRFHVDFCVNCEKLNAVFKDRNNRSPKCLSTVVGDLYQSNELHMRSSYADLLDDTWGRWTYSIAKKSSLWMWNKAVYGGYNDETMFVLVSLLQENAMKLLEQHYTKVKYENTDNMVPWNVIKSLYKIDQNPVSEENLVCIIGYLKSLGKCRVALTDENEKLVKFAPKGQNKTEAISKIDIDITKLKKGIAKLHMECSQVEKEVQKLAGNAKTLLHRKEREKAKKIIVQKNRVDKKLQMKQNALFGMREQLRMVQDAESTKMIADVFKVSASVISETYKQSGLTVDSVDDVLDQTLEVRDMVAEIDEALASGLQRVDDDYDMDELERELEELKEDSPKPGPSVVSKVKPITEPMDMDMLPDVPSELPTTPPSGKSKIKRVDPIIFS